MSVIFNNGIQCFKIYVYFVLIVFNFNQKLL